MNNKKLNVLILCFSFFIQGISYATDNLDQVAAVVNDDAILLSEVENRTKALQATGKLPSNTAQNDAIKQGLEDLILERLQLQQAETKGISINDLQIDQTIDAFIKQEGQDLPQFKQTLTESGMTFEEFREQTRRNLTLEALRKFQLQDKIKINAQEMQDLISTQSEALTEGERYHALHLLIAIPSGHSAQAETYEKKTQELRKRILAGEDFAQLARSYSASYDAKQGGDLNWQTASALPETFRSTLTLLNVGDVSDVVRDAQGYHLFKLLEREGGKRKFATVVRTRHILIGTDSVDSEEQAQQKINAIYQRALQGESFSELAKKNSTDTNSAIKGGDIGWVKTGQTVAEFEQMLSNTPENAISQPFKTQFGWHILQVLARKQEDNTANVLRTKAGEFLQGRKMDEQYQAWLSTVRNASNIEYRLSHIANQLELKP